MKSGVGGPSERRILEGVRRVMRDHVGLDGPLTLETHLLRDLELDSLKQLTLVVELENHFHICFDQGDEEGIETVGDLVERIREHVHGNERHE
jgi:acyl carrier protein